jgi:hypothetical protein
MDSKLGQLLVAKPEQATRTFLLLMELDLQIRTELEGLKQQVAREQLAGRKD